MLKLLFVANAVKSLRYELFLRACEITSLDVFIEKFDQCSFEIPASDWTKSYKEFKSESKSISYVKETTRFNEKSSYQASEKGVLNINLFRRSMVHGTKSDISMYLCNLSDKQVKTLVCEQLFSSDEDKFQLFISTHGEILKKLQTYIYISSYYNSCNG